MARIFLISCVSQKLDYRAKARDLYISTLFRYSLRYAESQKHDKIFILSAEYGLLSLEKDVDPYDVTLSQVPKKKREENPKLKVLSREERKEWANKVLNQLREEANLDKDEFIFLAGRRYREFLLPYLAQKPEIPMEKLSIGKQLEWLKERVK